MIDRARRPTDRADALPAGPTTRPCGMAELQSTSRAIDQSTDRPVDRSTDLRSRRSRYFFLPFLPPAFLAGAFLAGAFLAGAFLAGAFLAAAFFGAALFLLLRLLPPTWRSLRATSPSPSR